MPETIQEAYDFMRSVNEYIIFKVRPFNLEAEEITAKIRLELIDAGATMSKDRRRWRTP